MLEPRCAEVTVTGQHLVDLNEAAEVSILHDKWMGTEEGYNPLPKISAPADHIRHHAAPQAFRPYGTASEERDQRVQDVPGILMLVHLEDRIDLPAKRTHTGMPMDRHGETTLSVDETDHPLGIELKHRPCSFLLIVRTGRIFTAHGPEPYGEGGT